MPLKRGTNKKSTKLAADAEVFNNGEKEIVELTTDAKNLPNGNLLNDTEDAKSSTKGKAIKRVSGRTKNVAPELEPEAPPSKKPVAKGRGKKKSNENEVIENETDSAQPESQEADEANEVEVKTKPKGRGGGKKAEPKIKNTKAKEDGFGNIEETMVSEKNTKTAGGRKKKQDVPKIEDQKDIEEPIEEEVAEEKVSKKTSRNLKKTEEVTTEIEPQKKKGRTSKKDKPIEKDEAEVAVSEVDEAKADVKEKKPTKRGRAAAAAKVVTATEETSAVNGDAEEVLPKKRSRKAPSVEKEIIKEKPKRARAKKADKVDEEIIENAQEQETAENDTNGEIEEDKIEELKDDVI